MKNKERDRWDDAIRSKLIDFEAEAMPDEWDAIAGRLPKRAPVVMRRSFHYWIAAAIALLVMSGISYYLSNSSNKGKEPLLVGGMPVLPDTTFKGEAIQPLVQPSKSEILLADIPEKSGSVRSKAVRRHPVTSRMLSVGQAVSESQNVLRRAKQTEEVVILDEESQEMPVEAFSQEEIALVSERTLLADVEDTSALTAKKASKKNKKRKWGFGMGGGSFSVGADNLVPQYVTNSSVLQSDNLMSLNGYSAEKIVPAKTNIHHKTPIGIGISVSRYLNDRFSLQTGLNYSYLRSEWTTNNTYHMENDQRLHFLGIPLSITYKIAEWNRFMFYASAGGMVEVNVAGKCKGTLFANDMEIAHQNERVRMKEWLWSVNARAGVSYPIIRFVSAFGEVGASYYFDNGSDIETIHSEKPFNVSLQFGFRFGF